MNNMTTQIPNVSSLKEVLELTQFITKGDVFPQWRGKSYDAAIAILFGQSLGLSWGQSLLNIAVINGRPTVWGDAMLALCKISPVWEDIDEDFEEETMTAFCLVKRKGQKEQMRKYSLKDAERAGLLRKENWVKNTPRMLQMRARAFALRDVFPDILQGLGCAEEVQDYPESVKPASGKKTNIVSLRALTPAESLSHDAPASPSSFTLMHERLNTERQRQQQKGNEALERLKTMLPALQQGKGA